jgi:hypothetical protein
MKNWHSFAVNCKIIGIRVLNLRIFSDRTHRVFVQCLGKTTRNLSFASGQIQSLYALLFMNKRNKAMFTFQMSRIVSSSIIGIKGMPKI